MGLVIAVDGPAAAGKGTLARMLAAEFGLAHLDTGALYRAVARLVMDAGVDPDDTDACTAIADNMDPASTARPDLRGEKVGRMASRVSAIPGVRTALFEVQRRFAASPPDGAAGAVLDGRDIGTVICPDANLKIYLLADPDARARRRHAEAPDGPCIGEIAASIRERDTREATRAVAPMCPADDAVIIDTSRLAPADVLARAIDALHAAVPSVSGSPGR